MQDVFNESATNRNVADESNHACGKNTIGASMSPQYSMRELHPLTVVILHGIPGFQHGYHFHDWCGYLSQRMAGDSKQITHMFDSAYPAMFVIFSYPLTCLQAAASIAIIRLESRLHDVVRHPGRRFADVKGQLAVAQRNVRSRHTVKAAQMIGP